MHNLQLQKDGGTWLPRQGPAAAANELGNRDFQFKTPREKFWHSIRQSAKMPARSVHWLLKGCADRLDKSSTRPKNPSDRRTRQGSGNATIARGECAVTSHDDFHRQLLGYGLSTAEINYYLPDFPSVLQVFVWQHYDEAPHFPLLNRFLEHWRHDIDAVVHSVRLAHSMLLGPRVWHPVGGIIKIQ